MNNIYDEAHVLARSIKESPECQSFTQAQERLKANPENYKIAQEFFTKQMSVQTRQMMGQTLSPDEISAFNTLATAVMSNPDVAQYIQAQMAFFKVYQDVMGIINDAAGLDMGMFGNLGI